MPIYAYFLFSALLTRFVMCVLAVLDNIHNYPHKKVLEPGFAEEYADQYFRLKLKINKVLTKYQFIAADNATCEFWRKYNGRYPKDHLIKDYEVLTELLNKKAVELDEQFKVTPKKGYLPRVIIEFN